ncbi:MAG: molybdate ABC transporter substrate-binding protein [Frankiales bacterium]|nr:molybdate ABC transporter substrate-binding protein [Frankiales bacterium]
MRLRNCLAVSTALAALAATGCGGSGSAGPGNGSANHAPVTVFAASSLTNAFTAEGAAYTKQTGRKVTFSFAGSQELVAQIQNGAPADVLATADETTMATVAAQLRAPSQVFAHNRLVIVVAPGNPHHVNSLADLANRKLAVVLAGPTVPAGKYAATALQAAHVKVHPKSLELEVRSVLTKVELGEADAGVVYTTDATSAGSKVTAVPIASSPIATYPIGALTQRGVSFADFVRSPAGEQILRRFGFLPP